MDEKKELIDYIEFMINTEKEELLRIALESIETYIKSTLTFGFTTINHECLTIIKDMFNIISKERKLLKHILKNINRIDINYTWDTITTLDELNERTYDSYEKILDNIEVACETRNKNRIIKPNKKIDSLITNEEYEKLVLKLTEKKRN